MDGFKFCFLRRLFSRSPSRSAVICIVSSKATGNLCRVCSDAIERLLYKLCGVDAKEQQDWKQYAVAMLVFSAITLLVTYGIERLQHILPLNPQNFGPVPADLAFNTAASFTTNTNWQSYSGESTMSYLTQMAGLAWHNFISASVGIGIALALARGITYRLQAGAAKTLGNFWVDLVRATVYVLIPISIPIALLLVSQGVIQNFSSYVEITTLEGVKQTLAMGPVASQEVIKELGTNGGGFFNANSAHPFESPTPLTNLIEMLLIFAIPAGDHLHVRTDGAGPEAGLGDLRRNGASFSSLAYETAYRFEADGNPIMHGVPVDQTPETWKARKSASEL